MIPRFFSRWILAGVCLPISLGAAEVEAYKWSVQYLIDQSQAVFGRKQDRFPRGNRALAISPDARFIYAGYHQSHDGSGELRKIDLEEVEDFVQATVKVQPGLQPKAIAVDDEGRVYASDRDAVVIYDPELETEEFRFPAAQCDGLAVTREGGALVVYATERDSAHLRRWVLRTEGKKVAGAEPAGFNGDGRREIEGAGDLRGLAIDPKGRIWIADLGGGRVFRFEPGKDELQSVAVRTPLAIACDGARVLVTQARERTITLINEEMSIIGTLNVPWDELKLVPKGESRFGALSGIVVIPEKGFLVSNERGQTANQRSTYGKPDEHSDLLEGALFLDGRADDNEPILRATPVVVGP